MDDSNPRRRLLFLGGAMLLAALAAVGAAALAVNIFERKQEARQPFYRVVELSDTTEDPAIWGKNFPLQYDDYKRTVDMTRTKYGGSEAVPRAPTAKDPREQSHDYTTSTKSNPIETLLPAHAVPQLFPPKASGTIESRNRANELASGGMSRAK